MTQTVKNRDVPNLRTLIQSTEVFPRRYNQPSPVSNYFLDVPAPRPGSCKMTTEMADLCQK